MLPSGWAYRVIYPCGDKTKISVALVVDYEEKDWCIASRCLWDNEAEAIEYAKNLARANNKEYVGKNNEPDYLD